MSSPRKKAIVSKHSAAGAATIAIIEDDQDLLEILTQTLENEDFKTLPYGHPEIAIVDLLGGKMTPDLIVIDYRMPLMNGVEFLRAKADAPHERVRSIPTILMTAEPDVLQLTQQVSVTRVLRKPPDLKLFLKTVRECLEL